VKPHLDSSGALLSLQTILFRPDWDRVQNALYSYRRLFTKAALQELNGKEAVLEDLDPELSVISGNTTFWTYVGGVGRRLLEVDNIDEYIYAVGTAIDFTPDPRLSDSIFAVGRIQRALNDIAKYAERQENTEFITSDAWQKLVRNAFDQENLSRISEGVYSQRSPNGTRSRLISYVEELNNSANVLLRSYDGSKAAFQDRYAKLERSLGALKNYFLYLNDRSYASQVSAGVSKGAPDEAPESQKEMPQS
jgi:hypothetical protein